MPKFCQSKASFRGNQARGNVKDMKMTKAGQILSGQIIATSHDLTPNGGLVRGIPLFQRNLGW